MTIGKLFGIIVGVALLVYFGFQLHLLWNPPVLELASPPPDLITREKSIEIAGRTEAGARVVINGTPISVEQDGSFSKLLVLNRGLNSITVSAKKRYSRSRTIERQILIQDGDSLTRIDDGLN